MKIYKRSIWSSVTIWAFFPAVFILISLILFVIFSDLPGNALLVIPFVLPLMVMMISATAFFYIEMTDDELILRNIVYRFWHKAYPYRTITRIKLKQSGGLTQTQLQIIRGQKKSWSYVIDLVSPDDYKMLIGELQKQGIAVETHHVKIR